MDEKSSLSLLKECRAILSGHFLLASGSHSDTYFQCARLFEQPEAAAKMMDALAGKVRSRGAKVVAGPAVGGILPAHELARALQVRSIFLEKVDGTFTLRRGFAVSAGEKVLMAEDVVTTGGSVKAAAKSLTQAGAEIVGFASVVNRGGSNLDLVSMIQIQPKIWKPDECPLCKERVPLGKQGGVR